MRAAFLTAMEAARDRSRALAGGEFRVTGPACAVFDPSLVEYDFGASHPMNPIRVDLTMRLAEELGVVPELPVVGAPMASDELLLTVHDEELIESVRRIGEDPSRLDLRRGLGTEDNPTFAGMHHASAHIVGATVEAARRVWTGEVLHAANITGGLHHAMPGRASGFCVYNDVAVGIRWLLDHGAQRVAYVDVDVHHGDGVERVFCDDPRVLTISLHETGQMLFPGTGFPEDVGGPDAEGTRGQRRAPAGHLGRRVAAGLPRRGAAAAAGVRPRHPGDPARLRLAHRGPAGAPHAHRGRAAGVVPRPARARPRGLRAGAGSRPAAAATRSWTSCPGPGPTCWRSWPARHWTRDADVPQGWREHVCIRSGARRRCG